MKCEGDTLLWEHNPKPTCGASIWWPTFYTCWNWLCWSILYLYTQFLQVYICLFTRPSTRVIHLELTDMLTADLFLLAFRRFVARLGLPSSVWLDNAKTVKVTSKDIQRIVLLPEVANYLTSNRVIWKLIVERAPWWGGFWKRMVHSVNRVRDNTLQK